MRGIIALKASLVASSVLAAAVGLAISPASTASAAIDGLTANSVSAGSTWTVSGSTGTFSGVATNPTLTDTQTGTALRCKSAGVSGTVLNGTGQPGTGIGSFTSATWTSCSGPLGIAYNATGSNFPWKFNAVSYNAGVTTGTLTNVKTHMSGVGCTADFGGSTSGSAATLDVKYSNSTHTLTVLGTGDLHIWNVSGECLGLFNSGDSVSFQGDVVSLDNITIMSP
ncbi:hypothetical protein [Streptomyces sp. Tue6028]|uniref:hypothetical protein n=1 Tax=Streptomyces sp. Tue6028 TaxID=2036037 RepID=UPI003D73ACD6